MKFTRNELKTVVKECLIEILAEGMGASTKNDISESVKKQSLKNNVSPTFPAAKQNTARARIQSQALREAIKAEAGGNDIMASILADTAEKSLPAMLESDRPGVANLPKRGAAESIVASTDPEDLFGEEVASKWASLAFDVTPKK